MRKIFALVVLALLAAQGIAEFTEKAQIQVLDGELRPIEGAGIYPIYQLNHRVGLVNGKPKLTNKDGYVNITFYNNEFDPNVTDGNYTLVVTYGAAKVEKAVEYLQNRRWDLQVQLPVHYASFLVVDQQGRPLGANVSIGNFTRAVDGSGRAYFHLADGNYEYSVEAMGVVKHGSIEVGNDTAEKVEMRQYTMLLFIVDENAEPLQASVLALGKEYKTNEAGKLVVKGLGEGSLDVDVEYKGKRKVVNLNLENGQEIEVVFDMTAPAIKDAKVNVVDGAGHISFRIADDGAKASGVDANTSIRVVYAANGVQEEATIFPVGYGGYEAEIPIQPANTVVAYTIKVTDREGNEASKQGEYTVIVNETRKVTEVPTAQTSQPFGVDALQLIGAVVIVGILIGLFVYVKKRMDDAKPPPEIVP